MIVLLRQNNFYLILRLSIHIYSSPRVFPICKMPFIHEEAFDMLMSIKKCHQISIGIDWYFSNSKDAVRVLYMYVLTVSKLCKICFFLNESSNDTLHELYSHLKFQSLPQVPLLPVCCEKLKYHQSILYIGFGFNIYLRTISVI